MTDRRGNAQKSAGIITTPKVSKEPHFVTHEDLNVHEFNNIIDKYVNNDPQQVVLTSSDREKYVEFVTNLLGIPPEKASEHFNTIAGIDIGSEWEQTRQETIRARLAEAGGKRTGETAIDYYIRAWLPLHREGLIYQDDLTHAGLGSTLIRIRQHANCDEFLPPKAYQRAYDELAAISPDSARAEKLRQMIANRAKVAKSRGTKRNPR